MEELEISPLARLSASGGQVLAEYVLVLGLVLLVCFLLVGAIGVQVSDLLALVLSAFGA